MLNRGCPSQQGEILMSFRLKTELINDEQPFREKKNVRRLHTHVGTNTSQIRSKLQLLAWSVRRMQRASWFHITSDSCQLEAGCVVSVPE